MRRKALIVLAVLVIIILHQKLSGQIVGTVNFSGDHDLNIDILANPDAHHWQWLSFPGARLVLNPSMDDTHIPGDPEHDMPLNLGGWIGAKTVKMLRLNQIRMGPDKLLLKEAEYLNSIWYPYKYEYSARYSDGSSAQTEDFFIDSNATLIRHIKVDSKSNTVLELKGDLAPAGRIRWYGSRATIESADERFSYALAFSQTTGGRPVPLRATPSITANKYAIYLRLPAGVSEFSVCFGISAKPESDHISIERATRACFAHEPGFWLRQSKSMMEGALRRVPAPAVWGIHADANHDVSAADHKRAYYAAWAFLIEDVIGILPENSFHFEQVMCGKPSLWNHGDPRAPGVAQWDSLFGIQWLAYVNPHAAWSAFQGLMSLVDERGAIAGESLPARKAQTAWILYSLTKDRTKLKAVYPAIKRNLLWEESNPRWIYGSHNDPDEHDLEFTSSWIYDAEFAIRICKVLPDCTDETFWTHEEERMTNDSQAWFFSDPSEIRQYNPIYAKRGHTLTSIDDDAWSAYIVQAIAIPQFPETVKHQLLDYFETRFRPSKLGLGADLYKYPDVNLIAYGLLDAHNVLTGPFVEGVLAESIRVGTFTEVVGKGQVAEGVQESLFSPVNIIEFTWLENRCRYDNGAPVAIPGFE
jgi:hypothetical protein